MGQRGHGMRRQAVPLGAKVASDRPNQAGEACLEGGCILNVVRESVQFNRLGSGSRGVLRSGGKRHAIQQGAFDSGGAGWRPSSQPVRADHGSPLASGALPDIAPQTARTPLLGPTEERQGRAKWRVLSGFGRICRPVAPYGSSSSACTPPTVLPPLKIPYHPSRLTDKMGVS